ncbi:putative short chain oxidoreductase/dehydrogenase [Xylariaceae sp. FL0255]|nr:putative short chain oxidoreductase/dehydrogenase [Xylariaceae sp. FL0255]
MAQSQQVWLITGAARGLGFEIAKSAIEAGHKVLACYRKKPEDTTNFDKLESLGGIWTQLDPSSEDAESRVRALVSEHGQIDVLVNNAGYGMMSSTEDIPVNVAQDIFNTNFFGPLRTIKGVLPSMREHKTGTIVNVSSSVVFHPHAGMGMYAATKNALEAFTETLQAELKTFDIRVMLVEPGATATEFGSPAGTSVMVPLSEPYTQEGGAIKQVLDWLLTGGLEGVASPSQAVAQRIVEAVDGTGFMAGKEIDLRLILGKDAGQQAEGRAAVYNNMMGLKEVWSSV